MRRGGWGWSDDCSCDGPLKGGCSVSGRVVNKDPTETLLFLVNSDVDGTHLATV